jgi:hypothetical protein
MSRFYSMGLVVKKKNLSQEDYQKIGKVYADEWTNDVVDAGYRNGGAGAVFSAEGTLCGGESEEEAHGRIRDAVNEVVSDCSVTTRWTYLEDLPCEEYTD